MTSGNPYSSGAPERPDIDALPADVGDVTQGHYDSLNAWIRHLEAALRFYADPASYAYGVIEEVKPGATARRTLGLHDDQPSR